MSPARPVQSVMRSLAFLVVLACLCPVGCSGKKEASAAPKPKTEAEKIREMEDKAKTTTDAATARIGTIASPGAKGWKPTSANFEEVGKAVDQRLAEAQNVLVEATITFDDPSSGKMVYQPEIRIADTKTFDVRYVLPETKEQMIWVRGDGVRRAESTDAVWRELPGFSHPGKALSEEEVLAFPRSFPKMMFGRLTDSRDVWGPLFSAWKNGVGGYKVFAEEKTYTVAGRKVTQYRIVATTSANGGAQVEVTVDAKALRPVAVRSNGRLKDGQSYKMLWTGGWKVGGTLDPKTFHLPKELPTGQGA